MTGGGCTMTGLLTIPNEKLYLGGTHIPGGGQQITGAHRRCTPNPNVNP